MRRCLQTGFRAFFQVRSRLTLSANPGLIRPCLFVLSEKGNVCLLFELVDYTHDFSKDMPEGGWYQIAWGFLKLVSKTGGRPKVGFSSLRRDTETLQASN